MTQNFEPDTRSLSLSLPEPTSRRLPWLFIFLLVVIGFGAALALHFTSWFPAMLGSSSPHDIADLQTKIDGLNNRVTDLEGQVSSLHDHTLSTTGPQASAPPPTVMPTPAVEAAPSSAPTTAEMARLEADFVTLSAGLSAQQALIKEAQSASTQSVETTQMTVAAAVAFMQLHDAARAGLGFQTELQALRGVVRNDATLQEKLGLLDPYAANGAPTAFALRETLLESEAGAVHAAERADAQDWWQRILVEAKSLVSVRPLHGGSTNSSFSQMEISLAKDDTKAALAGYAALSPDAQKYLASWHNDLVARDAIDDALHGLAARFSAITQGQP